MRAVDLPFVSGRMRVREQLAVWACGVVPTLLVLAFWTTLAVAQEAADPLVRRASAGNIELTVELDRTTLMVDDRLRLSMRVEAPAGVAVVFPEAGDQLGEFAIASVEQVEPESTDAGVTLWQRVYVLVPEAVGALTLPPLAVTFRNGTDSAAETLAIEPVTLTVSSVLPEGADAFLSKDVAPPVPLPAAAASPALWLLALALMALVVGFLAWRRWRRRNSIAPPEAAHLVALAQLERLRGLIGSGRSLEFYMHLSAILRLYAFRRFGLKAQSRTTEELLSDFAHLNGPVEPHREAIRALMTDCDLVKFARQEPPAQAMRSALQEAQGFVEGTADQRVLAEG